MSKRQPHQHLVLPLMIALAAGTASSAGAQVQWRSPKAPPFVPTKEALAELATRPGGRHVAVQLVRAVTEADRAELAMSGLRLGAPLGNRAFFAAIDPSKIRSGPSAISGLVTGVQEIDPEWKLHPTFALGEASGLTIVGTDTDADGKAQPVVAAYVVLHEDVALDAAAEAIIGKHGGVVRDRVESVNAMVVELPLSRVPALAGEDPVQWVEPALPLLTPTNAENRTLTRSNQVQAAPYNLNGAGVSVLVFDGGTVRASHQDFGGRATVIDGDGQANHATHVAGTVGGSGAASGGANRGMAPGVTILSAALSASGEFLYTNPGDIEYDYGLAWDLGADVSNNSIGTNTETNGFPCNWQGDYGVTDALIDAIVRGSQTVSDGAPFRVVWAAGNERQGSRCDVEGLGDYHSIAPPAGAKNHLCIGAVNANDDSMTGFSSWGPTDDGRLKPDFSAPGCQSGGDGGVTSCSSSSDTAYSVSCGTSMASPTAAGITALMLQDWAALYPGEPLPRNSTLKVLLAQSAEDRGNAGPDYQFGYGSIRADSAINLMRSGAHAERALGQNFSDVYSVNVPAGSGPLVITVAWDDAPATPNVVPSLVNDLDLRVTAPGGQRHYPWTLNPANPSAGAVRTVEDHLNNIEQVRVDAPAAGEWTIEVRGTEVPVGMQPYSIVASNTSFTHIGSVTLTLEPVALAPASIDSGSPTPVSLQVGIAGDTLVPGSVRLHYRGDGGAFQAVEMTHAGGGLYHATLPGFACEESPQYYFSAQGSQVGAVNLPAAGPAAAYTTLVGDVALTVFDMEADAGWTAGAPGDNATTGLWERGIPQATAAQPGEDTTPAPGVNCWITGRQSGSGVGSFDVDGGTTTLLSPVLDLSTASPATRIGYWRWYSNTAGAAPNADVFTVDLSNNGGTNWSTVEVVGPSGPGTSGGWNYFEFQPSTLLPLTANMRMRFIASDLGAGSIVEAAIDDFTVYAVQCTNDTCAADFDDNGAVEVPDIFSFLAAWFATQTAADFDGNGTVEVPDIFSFLAAWFAGC